MPSLRDIYKKPDTISDLITTKGDLLVRNTTAPTRLPIGTNDQVLVADSTVSAGMKWAFVDTGFATVNSSFTIPAVGNNVTITISNNKWIYAGMYVYIQDAGVFYVVSKSGSTSITVRNEYTDNSVPGTSIGIAKGIVPAGRRGSDGNNSYTVTTANFTVPAAESTVTISVVYTAWVSINQVIYISGAGYYRVESKTSNTITIFNLGYNGNASSGTITSGAVITTSGIKGLDGINAFTYTTASFTQPVINNNVIITIEDTRWLSVGQHIYIEDGGVYAVIDVISQISIEVQNLGLEENAANGVSIVSGKKVSPSGKTGLAGTNAIVTVLASSFTQPPISNNVTITIGTTEFLAEGSYIFITTGGFYKVISIVNSTNITIQNLGTSANSAPGSTINTGVLLSPSGLPGIDGVDGTNGTNGIDGQGIDHIEFTSSVANIDTYTIWGDVGETINLGTFDVINGTDGTDGADGINGVDGADGATGSVNAASSLSLDHQLSDPAAIVDKLVLYSLIDGLYYRQPDGTVSQVLIDSDIGTEIGNIVELVDVGGVPGLPAVDGSQLLNLLQGGHTIQNEDIDLTQREKLNFTGDLVNADDNAVDGVTDITITSGLSNLGDILYHDGSGLASLPKGTAGQVLTSDDVAGLAWADGGTGGAMLFDNAPTEVSVTTSELAAGASEIVSLPYPRVCVLSDLTADTDCDVEFYSFYDLNLVDPLYDITSLLIKGNGIQNSTNILDLSKYSHSLSIIGNTLNTNLSSKYNATSIYFDGSGDAIYLPVSNELYFGTNNFTVEFWMKTDGTQDAFSALISVYSNAPSTGGSQVFGISNYSGTPLANNGSNNGQWHHVAFCRTSLTETILFLDGVAISTNSSLVSTTVYSMEGGRISRSQVNDATDNNYKGWLDDIRVIKGLALYTTNFTPPSTSFTLSDLGKSILNSYPLTANILQETNLLAFNEDPADSYLKAKITNTSASLAAITLTTEIIPVFSPTGMTWRLATVSQNAQPETGYFFDTDQPVTLTLPSNPAIGTAVYTGLLQSTTLTVTGGVINGGSNATINTVGQLHRFIYTNPTYGWFYEVLTSTGGALTIKDEGIDLAQRSALNFTGELVTVTDNSGADSIDVAINFPTTINLGIWTP